MTKITQQARDIAAAVHEENGLSLSADLVRRGEGDGSFTVRMVQAALDGPRPAMSDQKIQQRADEATAKAFTAYEFMTREDLARMTALTALRNLDKPLPVDPATAACREIMQRDGFNPDADLTVLRSVTAAYEAGKAARSD